MLSSDCGPTVPKTPSSTINKMLAARCGKKHENVVKGALAYYICGFFHVITTFYNAINMNSEKDSHRLWMTACAVISSLIVLKAYLVYNIIMASAFVIHTLLYYSAISLGLFGVGLGVSGAMFFDKEGQRESDPSPAPAPPPRKKFPEGAVVVPEMVKNIETPEAASGSPAPVVTELSSGTHGSPTETKPLEEKKAE